MASNSIGRLSLQLSADSAGFKRDLDKAGAMVDSFGGEMRRKYQKMSDDISKAKLASTPFHVNKTVAMEGALNAANSRRDSLLATARINAGQGRFGSMTGGSSVGIGVDKLVAGLGKFGPVAAAAAVGVGLATAAVVGFWKAAISLASAANPFAAERYNDAWADLNAVLGRVFVPILTLATDGVRLFADFMATILPTTAEVEAAFAGLKDTMTDLRDAAKDVSPRVKNAMTNYMNWGGKIVDFFAKPITWGAKATSILAGGGDGTGESLKSSLNAAPTARSFVGLEELGRGDILKSMDEQMVAAAEETRDAQKETNRLLGVIASSYAATGSVGFGIGRAIVGAVI